MVYHILKDGTITKDITGRVVKVDDARSLYDLMRSISTQSSKKNQKRKKAS